MDRSLFAPALRDQLDQLLAFTPASELYAIPTGDVSANPSRRVALKWLEAGLLMEPQREVRGFRPVRQTKGA